MKARVDELEEEARDASDPSHAQGLTIDTQFGGSRVYKAHQARHHQT
jgi:hypothetical protein